MAYRVDDIVVSNKNVFLLSDGRQLVADIEKENEKTDSISMYRTKNPWNLFTEDGHVINNIFDVSDFEVRTQVVTGSTGASLNYKRTHENFIMPKQSDIIGMCQFYDSAYTISDNLTGRFTSTYHTSDGSDCGTYESDISFIRYKCLSSYDNMVDYYITPDIAFEKSNGVQYFTEYPLNKFYSDFGDNEDSETPTVYGDSHILKYYLDENYSVNSYDIENENIFEKLRTYYNIGNSGNSIYIVYRTDMNGTSVISSNGGTHLDTINYNIDDYIISTQLSSVGYMSNIVTISNAVSGLMYAANPFSDFFRYTQLSDLNGFSFVKQPHDFSFELFFKTDGNSMTLTYIPLNGLDKSRVSMTIGEIITEDNVITLDSRLLIATDTRGVINVSVCDYEFKNDTANVEFSPFRTSVVGTPDSSDNIRLDEEYGLSSIKWFYNNDDIIGITASQTISGKVYNVSMLSTSTSADDGDIGCYFLPIGNPKYELDVKTVNLYSPETEVISSVLSSWMEGEVKRYAYVLSSVTTYELTGLITSEYYFPSSNEIRNDSEILFDYSSVNIDGEIKQGSYAFVQFDEFGLTKCHASDIFKNDKFVRSTPTGVVNKDDHLRNGSICKDVHFDFKSYGDSIRTSDSELSYFIDIASNSDVIYGLPSLYVVYKDSDGYYYNSFSTIPFTSDREIIHEPTFASTNVSTAVEQSVISSFNFILDKPIENSNAVSVKMIDTDNINHDFSACIVRWNEPNNIYNVADADYNNSSTSISGLHLQHCGICTEVFVKGKNTKQSKYGSGDENLYKSVVYEYPHPCFGSFKTAGTGLSIFDGELSSSMTVGDITTVNDYLIVKNYAVKNNRTNINDQLSSTIRNSGKYYRHDTGNFPTGGYVVSNSFKETNDIINNIYDYKLISSSKTESKTNLASETVYDYAYLWHIKPANHLKFYPESKSGEEWKPYYVNKYVDFIKYSNGYYYIALSNSKVKGASTIGYELIETKDLFTESECIQLSVGKYVKGVEFFDGIVAVEYYDANGAENKKESLMWFKQGNLSGKTYSIAYCNSSDTSLKSEPISTINRACLNASKDTSNTNVGSIDSNILFDNVETICSLNKFSSVVNHKSNMFSIKISDLGLDSSPYLSDTQKKNIRNWLKNRITTIVDSVKPANTQLFDVYID